MTTTHGKANIIPIILCGGSGSRLWPLSTQSLPKPFIRLPNGETLLEKTYKRAMALPNIEEVITITNQKFGDLCAKEFKKASSSKPGLYLLEPQGRDTAAAILLAALAAKHFVDDESILLVLPADHLIDEEENFRLAVEQAVELAQDGRIVTFGVKTDHPATAYGYLHRGKKLTPSAALIDKFIEKPPLEQAEIYHNSPDYFWNSGMFCFKTSKILEEFQTHRPALFETGLKTWNTTVAPSRNLVINTDFLSQMEKISFDYAIMEKTSSAAMVAADFTWKDIGSWTIYANLVESDEMKNHLINEGKAFMKGVRDNILIFNNPDRKIAIIGLNNMVVIDTDEGLLIADKSMIQDVKDAANYFVDKQ